MSAEDVQETSSKHVKDPESVMVVKHCNVLGKEEQELETVVVDMNDEAPSKPEQNIAFVGKAHLDVPVKPKQNLETVMEKTHIDELGELEQTSGLSITNICIGDLSNSQEDLVTISINDCHPNDALNGGQNCVSSDGNLSCVNVSSLETKDFTAETRSIIVGDSQEYIASDLRKASISIKHSSKNILAVPLCNKSANYSPRLNGTCVDPSSTMLINREMEVGKVSNSSKARNFSTPQNANKVFPCSTYSQIQVRVNKKLKNVNNEFSIGRQNFMENTVHYSDNDEALISRQLDELTGIDNNIAAENNRPVNEIMKTSNNKTVSEINDVNCKTQDGSNHSCCFCRHILKRSKGNTWLSLNKPLPLSLLNPISLLQCLGISSPLLATGRTNDNLISVCRQCYALLSDGDAVYQRLLSVISQMKQLWPDDDSELLTVTVSSNGSDKALKKNQILQILKNKQPLQSSHTTHRKCRFILPKPDMVKESHSLLNNIDGKMAKVRLKKEHSYNKMRICGFCGMDLYGEDEWNLHQAAVHLVDQKWRWFNLQPTLKTLLAKKIQQFNVKQNEDLRQNFQYEMTNAHKCAACSSNFSLHDEFVVHLRQYHNMVVDEDFLSSVLEDANLMNKRNISEREHMENPIQIKSEVMWHDQYGKSSVSDMVHSNSIQDNDAITCEEMGMQRIIDCGKEEQSQINTENQSLRVPDDFHNYIGTKDTVKLEKENSKKDCRVELCCSICEKSFIRQSDLEKHEQFQHSKSVKMSETKVIKDNKLVPSPGINSLPRTLRAKTKVTCKLCNQICCSSEDLNYHVDTCHENSVVILNKDGYGGVIDNRLHMSKAIGSDLDVQNESEVPKFQANASGKKLDKTQSFVCRVCGNTFVNRLLLVRHKCSSHGDVCGVGEGNGLVMVECNLCGRRLNGIRSLHLHMSKVHKKSPKYPLKHRCKICIYHSKTRNQLEKHMQEKHGLNVLPPVECKECGKMYSAKYIDIHIANMHENQKRFSCNFCAMKFNVKSSLKCHISYEHANNKWPCVKCHIEFEKYHQLRQHRIYVHSTKIYTCQQCGKTFKRKSDMTEHEKRRHMEKIMSECTYCTKAYADRKKLRTHLIKKHGVAWEDTLSKSYARHQQENNCLRKRQHRSSSASQNLPHNEETEGIGIQQSKYDLEHTGQHVLYEEGQKGLFEEQYQDGDSCQIYQHQHCAQVEERTITTYEGASVETLENEQEYNMVQVTEGSENITNMANICYIVLEETQP